MGQVLEYSRAIAHSDVALSTNFIAATECPYCGGKAPMINMVRGPSPRSESIVEVRIFECESCLRHTALELVGA